ncbi:MAG: THUMP domain-containing protein [Oligoflexia bacterium]|nr:THUMP domain-containing protein [Oligoflexia bacterium]
MSKYFASCARGLEPHLEKEIIDLGATEVDVSSGGVWFSGEQDVFYKVNLWSRLASRVLLQLRNFHCHNDKDLYDELVKFRWETFFQKMYTFSIDVKSTGKLPKFLSNSHYVRQKAKDAIVDRLREKLGKRPDVDTKEPEISIVLHLEAGRCTLSLDGTGVPLHQRGYRAAEAEAPLRETLAAVLLKAIEWDPKTPLVDPFCGSGTILAEASLIAQNIAPGLNKDYFCFYNWPDFYKDRWQACIAEAKSKQIKLEKPQFFGSDVSQSAVNQTTKALRITGALEFSRLMRSDVSQIKIPEDFSPGVILMNPPYGDRMGNEEELVGLYKSIGDKAKHEWKNWRMGIFTGSSLLAKSIGLRTSKRIAFWNGNIECRLLTYNLY